MYPLLLLSLLSVGTVLERLWFWWTVLSEERELVRRVLESAAQGAWQTAEDVARLGQNQPIGRFLHTALKLDAPAPEIFQLALESAADDELASMRRGDKILEGVIALAPLLGLLGTVWGLIASLSSIRISDLGTQATSGVTLGIGEALISTASGLIVAIFSLAFYRLFQVFLFNQIKVFRKSGNDLELMYRQAWAAGSIQAAQAARAAQQGEQLGGATSGAIGLADTLVKPIESGASSDKPPLSPLYAPPSSPIIQMPDSTSPTDPSN